MKHSESQASYQNSNVPATWAISFHYLISDQGCIQLPNICWFSDPFAELLPHKISSQNFSLICSINLFSSVILTNSNPLQLAELVGWCSEASGSYSELLGSKLDRASTIPIKPLHRFLIFSHWMAQYYLERVRDRFLPHTFQLNIHYSTYLSTLHILSHWKQR
jgi:hypothetical protein